MSKVVNSFINIYKYKYCKEECITVLLKNIQDQEIKLLNSILMNKVFTLKKYKYEKLIYPN